MKFLKNWDGRDIMPINFIYHEGEKYKPDDSLDVIYKDMTTGRKHVETIQNPKIEVAIVKPEFRTFDHFRDYVPAEETYTIQVSFKNRYKEIADHMKIPLKDIKYCPYVLGSDLKIHTYYLMYFLREYHNDTPKELHITCLDTEADVRDFIGFPPIGAAPSTIISFVDDSSNEVYSFILRNPKNPLVQDLEDRVEEFIADCHKDFDESYGELNYNIMFFDREIELLVALFSILNAIDSDYILVWNLPYDIQYLIERIKNLGYDPTSVICNKEFENKICYFKEDTNPTVHKRKHDCKISMMSVWLDQMVIYAGVRSAGSKLPSNKLNFIAKRELNDEKLDYSEEANIGEFPWRNFWKYCKYNIKDILLQLGIHRRTNDMTDIYTRCYGDALLPSEVFTTTTMLANSFKTYIETDYSIPMIFGNNRNKIFEPSTTYHIQDGDTERLIDAFGRDPDDLMSDEEEEEEEGKTKKKEKFDGAIVSNANRMGPTGMVLNGTPNSKCHENVIDYDITSTLAWVI